MAIKFRGTMLKLCVFFGTLAILLPGMVTSVSAAPPKSQYIECSSTKAKGLATAHSTYDIGKAQVEVWVTFDKLVDANTLVWCGEIRNHSQVRITYAGQSGYVGGTLAFGNTIYFNAEVSAFYGTVDSFGSWRVSSCGTVQAYFRVGSTRYSSPSLYRCAS